MNEQQLQGIIYAAVSAALQVQRKEFEARIEQLTNQFTTVTAPEIKAYEPIKIIDGVECHEGLDAVKSVPEFDGSQELYVSWREAASQRMSDYRRQSVNYLTQEKNDVSQYKNQYDQAAYDAAAEIEAENVAGYETDTLNLLAEKAIGILHASSHIFSNIAARQIDRSNAYRQNMVFEVGEKSNKRLGDKVIPLHIEEKVDADLGTTVLIKGRVVHKDNLK